VIKTLTCTVDSLKILAGSLLECKLPVLGAQTAWSDALLEPSVAQLQLLALRVMERRSSFWMVTLSRAALFAV
jgi:hypothetical protein